MSRKNRVRMPKIAKCDVAKWAMRAKRRTGGTTCTLCAAAPDVGRALQVVLDLRKAGKSAVSQRELCMFFADKFGLNIHQSTLINHLNRHLRTPW